MKFVVSDATVRSRRDEWAVAAVFDHLVGEGANRHDVILFEPAWLLESGVA